MADKRGLGSGCFPAFPHIFPQPDGDKLVTPARPVFYVLPPVPKRACVSLHRLLLPLVLINITSKCRGKDMLCECANV